MKYPEIVFDTQHLSSFPYSIERPLPPSTQSDVHKAVQSLVLSGVSRKTASIKVGNSMNLSYNRVRALDFLERKRQSVLDSGGELMLDLVEEVEKNVAEHVKGCQFDGLQVRGEGEERS